MSTPSGTDSGSAVYRYAGAGLDDRRERLVGILNNNVFHLPLTQQGPDTTWARRKQFWQPGNVENPEGGQGRRRPEYAALEASSSILERQQTKTGSGYAEWLNVAGTTVKSPTTIDLLPSKNWVDGFGNATYAGKKNIGAMDGQSCI